MQAYSTASGGVMYVPDEITRSDTATNPYQGSITYKQLLEQTGEATPQSHIPTASHIKAA